MIKIDYFRTKFIKFMANLIDDNQLFCFNPLQWIVLLKIIKIDHFPTKSIKNLIDYFILIRYNELFYSKSLKLIIFQQNQ